MAMPEKLKSLLLSSIILTLTACGGGDNKNTKVDPPITPVEPPAFNYQAAIDGALSDTIPGVILLVEKPGFKFLGSAGLADIETQTPMQTYYVMPNGSAGKKLTALLTVMLAEEGLLSLDDTLDNWLSEEILAQIENSEQITLRQLLNHTSGIYNYTDGTNHDNYYEALLVSNKEQLKTDSYALAFGLNRAAYSLPGKEYHYSNTAYLLAGLILDEVLGEHHSTAMRNRILIPFGMNSSFYGGVEKSLGDIISGYAISNEYGVINTKPFYENIGLADAPLNSNVEDLALLLKTIVEQNGHVSEYVKDQLFGESHLLETDVDYLAGFDENSSAGLGLFKNVANNKVVYHHNGLEPGYSTTNIYITDSQTSITAFFNCGISDQCRLETDALTETILLNEL